MSPSSHHWILVVSPSSHHSILVMSSWINHPSRQPTLLRPETFSHNLVPFNRCNRLLRRGTRKVDRGIALKLLTDSPPGVQLTGQRVEIVEVIMLLMASVGPRVPLAFGVPNEVI